MDVEFFGRSNRNKIAANVYGRAGAMPLLLLHGARSDKSTWAALAPTFASSHRVYAVDLRGFGDSGRPGAYSCALMRDDMLELLDLIGAEKADVVGHSMGGSVAWLIAQEQPSRVAHLVIEDSVLPRADPDKTETKRFAEPVRPPQAELGFDWNALTAILAELDDPDPQWWQRIPMIEAPTLMLAGGPSSHVPQHLFAEALELLRDGRIVQIPVGHQIHRNAPEEFTAAVAPFLAAPAKL